eukprot:Opistho-2@84147
MSEVMDAAPSGPPPVADHSGHRTVPTTGHSHSVAGLSGLTGLTGLSEMPDLSGSKHHGALGDGPSQPASQARLSTLFKADAEAFGRSAPKASVVVADEAKKGSTFSVYLATTETMWGVIIFLRFAEVLSHAGLVLTLGTIWMSAILIAMVATASCAIATNGFIPYGGMYHILTKNIGHAMGGSIGALYYMGLVCLSATEIRGFSEAIESTMTMQDVDIPDLHGSYWFGTIISLVAFVVVCTLARNHLINEAIGIIVLVAVLCSFAATIVGGFATSGGWAVNNATGVYGLSTTLLADNAWPLWDGWDFRKILTFILPCFVGIFTVPNRASSLKSPYTSIPIGTFGAILTSAVLYSLLMVIMAATTTRDTLRLNLSMREIAWPSKYVVVAGMLLVGIGAAMQLQSTAPGILRAMAKDAIIPQIKRLRLDKPGRTEVVSMMIAIPFVFIPDLDNLATVVTLVFLLCYGFTSLACLSLQLLRLPGWRPKFRYHHWVLSLLAFLLTQIAMFAIQWIAAMLMVIAGFVLATMIQVLNADATWGSGTRAIHANLALSSLLSLEGSELKAGGRGNWRPQVLMLADMTEDNQLRHPRLVSFLHQLRKSKGLTIIGAIVNSEGRTLSECGEHVAHARASIRSAMAAEGLKGFGEAVFAPTLSIGRSMIIQQSGIGAVRPNSVLVAWPDGWREDASLAAQIVAVVEETQVSGKALIVARGIESFPLTSERMAGSVDVWWIVHEGGMLLLLGFLLTKHRVWKKCRLRLFVVAEFEDNSVAIEAALKNLLINLRISAEVTVVEMDAIDFQPFMQEWTVRLERRQETRKGVFPDELEDLASMALAPRESLFRRPSDSKERLRDEASDEAVGRPPSALHPQSGLSAKGTPVAVVRQTSHRSARLSTASTASGAARGSSASDSRSDTAKLSAAASPSSPSLSQGRGSVARDHTEIAMTVFSSSTAHAAGSPASPAVSRTDEESPHDAVHISRFLVQDASVVDIEQRHSLALPSDAAQPPSRSSVADSALDPVMTAADPTLGLRKRAHIVDPKDAHETHNTAREDSDGFFHYRADDGQTDAQRARKRTLAAVRLRQAVEALSSEAALVIMNMPLPDEAGREDPSRYMELLDGLTEKVPRVLLVMSSGQQVVSEFVE